MPTLKFQSKLHAHPTSHPAVRSVLRTAGPPRLRVRGSAADGTNAPSTSSLQSPVSSSSPPGSRDFTLDPFIALVQDKKFKCTQCGKCCTGDGEVWVTDKEVAGIAQFLNMGVAQFNAKYTKQYNKHKGFRLIKNNPDTNACIFLQPDNKCGIHTVRPGQCSTYPWWPELMDRKGWEWEKENICEGFDHAESTDLDLLDAARQLKLATTQEQMHTLARVHSKGSAMPEDGGVPSDVQEEISMLAKLKGIVKKQRP